MYGTAFAPASPPLPAPHTLTSSGVQRIVDHQLEKYNVSIPGRTTPGEAPAAPAQGYTPPAVSVQPSATKPA